MMINYTGTYTDQYQLSMALAYFKKGKADHTSVYDYFFRKNPFNGGYTIFSGLQPLLNTLENFRFDENDLAFLSQEGFPDDFLHYLKNFRFKGNIHSVSEGEVVFPVMPVLQVEASLIEAQLIETLLLNQLNFQSLISTKASRMRQMAGDKKLVDFGLRRAQGPGGYYASRAAIIGGFNATSNVRAGRDFNIPVSGTMAHSFIQSYDNELTAFRDFADIHPDNCILLVDTYDSLKSGIPNTIKVAKEMESAGRRVKGIRLDSGDLAYLSKKARQQLDEAGLDYVKIAASNQLDEYVIKSLMEQDAPIDLFGVGTSLVIGKPDAALDGVYKLSSANGKPRIKLSETIEKTTLPSRKQVFRLIDRDGNFSGADAIGLEDETKPEVMYHPFEAHKSMEIKNCRKETLLRTVMENGKSLIKTSTLGEISDFRAERENMLPPEYKRFTNPHEYKTGISTRLHSLRNKLIDEHKNTTS
jgi:nicotinate phosphoribosyltransferase